MVRTLGELDPADVAVIDALARLSRAYRMIASTSELPVAGKADYGHPVLTTFRRGPDPLIATASRKFRQSR
jgi:hypothetical protein